MLPILDILVEALGVGMPPTVQLPTVLLVCRSHHVTALHDGGVPLLEQLVEGVIGAKQAVQEVRLFLLVFAMELLFQT